MPSPSISRAPMIALAASLLALASPALADQFKESADGGTVQCSVSARELTRFALIGDQFASVSKISSGYPYNDFAVTRPSSSARKVRHSSASSSSPMLAGSSPRSRVSLCRHKVPQSRIPL